jgi:hypothetical protein
MLMWMVAVDINVMAFFLKLIASQKVRYVNIFIYLLFIDKFSFSRLEHTEDDGYSTATLSSDILSKNNIPKSIQKEYEILLTKSKRMETMIQTLENEKKSIQLTKDMELADIRSKNAALQKTVRNY